MSEGTGALIGRPVDRVDGRPKVTGRARYAADFQIPELAYAYAVPSTIARGRISGFEIAEAMAAPGVMTIITHQNAPALPGMSPGEKREGGASFAKPFVLQTDRVDHHGQYIAVVVAESFEHARDAAALVKAHYREESPELVFDPAMARTPEKLLSPEFKPEYRRGNVEQGLEESDIRTDESYVVPNLHNNPMEPHASIAIWDGPRLTVYESSQHVDGARKTIASLFGLKPQDVRVISRYIGGGFGCKVPVWEHTTLAIMAAQRVGRPVKIVVPRRQMFSGTGYRPRTEHRIKIGATKHGEILSLVHRIYTPTNMAQEYIEHASVVTPMMYSAPNLHVELKAAALNWPRGTITRASGVAPGLYALECAIDELAYAAKMDPIELRRRNEPPRDPQRQIPWSSRNLMECLEQGAGVFGWERRNPEPHSMRDGNLLVGMGVASATFPARCAPTTAIVHLAADGTAVVRLAATDIETGTYTILTQIAAETLGLLDNQVTVEIGDTDFPPTPGWGGSHGVASYSSAVQAACEAAREKVLALGRSDFPSRLGEPPHGKFEPANVHPQGNGSGSRAEMYASILSRHNQQEGIEAQADIKPGEAEERHSSHSFGAEFVEVRVDPDMGVLRVARMVGVFAAGRIVNAKTARSQLAGGMVMGLGMALMEESVMDGRYGNFVNSDLADYHVPVNGDVPDIEVALVDERDSVVNPLGIKGLGEIGVTGTAAAVANAVYHATGRRIRELPITVDKLI